MSFQGGPGGWTFTVGTAVVCVYIVGGVVSTAPDIPSPALWWSALGLLVAGVFVASVVAAYYAGKRRP